MQIWMDADACPQAIRDIVFRASRRLQVPVTFVANRAIAPHPSPLITSVRVGKELDAADAHIALWVEQGDIVITADIPLAAKVVVKGAVAIDPRGDVHTEENVGERLSVRNLLQGLRAEGLVTGGPAQFSNSDRQRFANALDRLLTALRQKV
ncbi:MAG: YaiI/YqxD family protein [Acidobacteria bacterium]|nr:MAG: YaiI/YqxD family protein [Acidobacteriota bacterium]